MLRRLGSRLTKARGLAGAAMATIGAAMICAIPHRAACAAEGASATSSPPSLPEAIKAATDIGGQRTALENKGLRFTFTYYGDVFANPAGGVKQGFGYDGRFGTIIDADLDKLAGWKGAAFHASIHQIHGTQFSATNLDNLMTVSGIEAPTSIRLFNLWVEQKIGTQWNLRAGQFTAAQEFLTSDNASLFVNSSFGWPMAYAQDLPSGGPAYPEATPGLRLAFTPNDRLTLRAAVFNGDPAGPGAGNPVERDPYGLAFRVNDPPFVIVEGAYEWGEKAGQPGFGNPNQEGIGIGGRRRRAAAAAAAETALPGSLKLGAWVHTGRFADQRFDSAGNLLAASAGPPLQHRGDVAAYAVLDQELWRVPGQGERGLSGFARISASPSDRNPVDLYADGGLAFRGPLADRPDDILGLALAFGRISPRAKAYDRDVAALSGQAMPIRDYELALELTYQWKMSEDWMIQPDLQLIVHPGGHVPMPADAAAIGAAAGSPAPTASAAIPDAAVFGLRTFMRF